MSQMSIYAKEGVKALNSGRGSRSSKIDAACHRYDALTRDMEIDACAEDLRELRRAMPSDRLWSVDEIRALPMVLREAARQAKTKAASRLERLADLAEREGLQGRIAMVAAAERMS